MVQEQIVAGKWLRVFGNYSVTDLPLSYFDAEQVSELINRIEHNGKVFLRFTVISQFVLDSYMTHLAILDGFGSRVVDGFLPCTDWAVFPDREQAVEWARARSAIRGTN